MKKLIILATVITAVLCINGDVWAAIYGGGTGEPNDPYQIWTPEEMNAIGENPTDWDKHFKLMTTIDMSVYTGTQYNIIGNETTPFTGTFDGNAKAISHLTYAVTYTAAGGDKYVGLFGYTDNATIKNLGLEDVDLSVEGYVNVVVGGLVGRNASGTITNCYCTGRVSSSSFSSFADAGGLVGTSSDTITNCYSTASVRAFSFSYASAGGLVGNYYHGSITNCYSTGSVSADSNDDASAGGLVGNYYHGSITHCYSTGSVSAYCLQLRSHGGGLVGYFSGTITDCYSTGSVRSFAFSSYAGGLVGYFSGTITHCYSTGSVSAPADIVSYAGGLAGYFSGTITHCNSTGSVSAVSLGSNRNVSYSYAGGLVGSSSGTITNCYSTGTVTSSSLSYIEDSRSHAGGLVGWLSNSVSAKIEKCYSTGEVTAAGDNVFTGGLLGYKEGSNGILVDCFWDMQTSGLATSAGDSGVQGKTTAQMRTLLTFTNNDWDFTDETDNGSNDDWRMCMDGLDYPRLSWEFSNQGDFACPGGVFIEDLEHFVAWWLSVDCADSNNCAETDITADDKIDLADYAIFSAHWLEYPVYPDLVGWWEFSKTSGTLANDSSWYGNHGTLVNDPVWTGDGKLNFDGVNDYVEVPDSTSLDITNQITISIWIYMDQYSTDWPKLVIKPYDIEDTDPWELYVLDLGHYGMYPRFILSDGVPSGNGVYTMNTSFTLTLNQWHHIVGTYDGATISLYVDGQLISSDTGTIQVGTNNLPLSIGGRLGFRSFNGLIDEVRVYNRSLTAAEIVDLYQEHDTGGTE